MAKRRPNPEEIPAGLCAACVYRSYVTNARGSKFLLCRRSVSDPSFPKYPRLPVLSCSGYEKEKIEIDQSNPNC
jgi:hypothetical protein